MDNPLKPTRRRWMRFSLRTLMVLMLVACVGMGWVAARMRTAKIQDEAVAAIEKVGGSVGYDDVDHWGQKLEPKGPVWLRTMLGSTFFSDVTLVVLVGSDATDDALEGLDRLPHLHDLTLSGTSITDAGFQRLEAFKELRWLSVIDGKVPDVVLVHAKNLIHLRRLFLDGSEIAESGLEHIAQMPKLQGLALSGANVTDDSLAQISGLANLELLRLINTQITNGGLEHIKKMTKLKELSLDGTQISDDGLEPLAAMSQLENLGLCGTRVSKKGGVKL